MNELNVMNERFPRHLLDRLREKALEEVIEEERREFERELSFEAEKQSDDARRHERLPLFFLFSSFSQYSIDNSGILFNKAGR